MNATDSEILDNDVDISLLKGIPLAFSRTNGLLPLKIIDGYLSVAICDQNALFAANDLAKRLKLGLKTKEVSRQALMEAINRYYGAASNAGEVMGSISGLDLAEVAVEFNSPKDIVEAVGDAPVIKLINALFQEAVNKKASDIHIEPYEKDLEIRLRVDGIMHKILTPPKIAQEALISRIKVMAGLDIAEKRLPQDGRIRLLVASKDVDVRVSIIPTIHGERVVLRLLDRGKTLLGLRDIGLDNEEATRLESVVDTTHGMFLVTGPTGSGKTTTLYALIQQLRDEKKNIMTVENPVEYEIKGIAQMQVKPHIGLTFATGLRAILRQDPDCILVGEIRDPETAQTAIQASLTGHVVFSTLHTNSASSTIIRLMDLDVEPYLVSSCLLGILAQRLVRVICPHCKERYRPSDTEKSYFKDPPKELFRGKGCAFCLQEGYIGRTGIFELLVIDDELRAMIISGLDAQAISMKAVKKGMKSINADGMNKVLKGTTTLNEVLRVTQKEYSGI